MKKKSFGVLGWVCSFGGLLAISVDSQIHPSSSSKHIIQSIGRKDVDCCVCDFFQLIGCEASRAKDHEKVMLVLGMKCVVL